MNYSVIKHTVYIMTPKREVIRLIMILDSPEAKLRKDVLSCWIANDLLRYVSVEGVDIISKYINQ